METKKLGTEPAFPTDVRNMGGSTDTIPGMSKRFYAACAAMQGLCANADILKGAALWKGTTSDKAISWVESIAGTALEMADELLKQELT